MPHNLKAPLFLGAFAASFWRMAHPTSFVLLKPPLQTLPPHQEAPTKPQCRQRRATIKPAVYGIAHVRLTAVQDLRDLRHRKKFGHELTSLLENGAAYEHRSRRLLKKLNRNHRAVARRVWGAPFSGSCDFAVITQAHLLFSRLSHRFKII